jgi:hypothetical protein
MKTKIGMKIEVRFTETAEFNVAPKEGWDSEGECVE